MDRAADIANLEYQRARKVGQIRAYVFTEGWVSKERRREEKELKEIEDRLHLLKQEEL